MSREGSVSEVLYEPSKPEEARIKTFMMLRSLPTAFVLLDAFFLLLILSLPLVL